jgi:hypothetical protein
MERKVSPNMAGKGKKKEDITHTSDFEMRIPLGSDLAHRLRKISEMTGLSDHELLQKWIVQEESNLHVLQHYAEGIQLKLKHDLAGCLDGPPQRNQNDQQESLETNEELEEGSDQKQDYRQLLLQRIQDMRQQGITLSKIATQFNEEEVPTISGTGKWYSSSISQLLATQQ